ncbi:retropepsin-like aspartic protease family protein [Mangrovicella endophytica]|uniref:retropepsin-like aspartic protease family protein n=1 Tax=Mangrovicella endophytica TaxID=2066697 RepID=UPI000C9E1854|nr:TIGR02281 family clan AA aspartic protease [Mangrovicella endophytica]
MRGSLFLVLILGVIAGAVILLAVDADGQILGLQDSRFASLIYLGTIGVAIAAGLTASRSRLADTVKNALVWALAFAALIGAYAFSPELGGIKNRMLAVLMPGTPIEVAGSNGSQYVVTRGLDNHFHVDGEIDGVETAFMVDTGASMIALDEQTAKALGVDTSALRFTSQVMTANGIARAAPLRLKTVQIGQIVRHNVEAAVTEGSGLGVTLLGMSFLGTLSSFDFRGERLILTD